MSINVGCIFILLCFKCFVVSLIYVILISEDIQISLFATSFAKLEYRIIP